jgi:hypothetical protein
MQRIEELADPPIDGRRDQIFPEIDLRRMRQRRG